ncbi:MAG: hypothetical protein A2Z99_05520 [Treponema sp. GWB1_62_6]|nr:MAG: hypothetical protein A2Z99_05520 [Treponema sp. GWB1_62_6]
MKRKSVAIVVVIALIAALAAFAATFMIRIKKEIGMMDPAPTGLVASGVFAILDSFVNLYLVERDGKYLAVDAGTDAKNVRAEMARLGIAPEDVEVLLLTHTDYDHVDAASLFTNARVYISEREEDMLNGKAHKVLFFRNSLKTEHGFLADGEETRIGGWMVRTIVVRGHTSGSACFVVDGKYLFTGDNLSLREGKAAPFNDFFNMDTPTQRADLPKIAGLEGIELLATGHYGTTKAYAGATAGLAK